MHRRDKVAIVIHLCVQDNKGVDLVGFQLMRAKLSLTQQKNELATFVLQLQTTSEPKKSCALTFRPYRASYVTSSDHSHDSLMSM